MLCFRETAFGRVGIEDKEGFITRLYLPGRSDAVSEGPETPLLGEAFAQLEAYFSGRRKAFDLPLRFEGTPFMKRVWQALCMANNRNPIAIIVPCHRIIGSTGALVGYGGGLGMKERLLALEHRYGPAD